MQTSNLISRSTTVPNTVPGKLINIVSGFQNIYTITIYALRSAHEKFGVWIKAVPKSRFPAKPGGKNGWSRSNLK